MTARADDDRLIPVAQRRAAPHGSRQFFRGARRAATDTCQDRAGGRTMRPAADWASRAKDSGFLPALRVVPRGSRLCRCGLWEANFFFRENRFRAGSRRPNGKRIRPENVCGPTGRSPHRTLGVPACQRRTRITISMKNHDDRRAIKRYLLTCGCSAAVTVGPGQAGDAVTCPRCGA